MKTDILSRSLLLVIAILLAGNLFVNWHSMQTVHANSSYIVEPFGVSGGTGTFTAQGQIVAVVCDTHKCVAIEK
jgi:hypothetical protein